MKEISLITQAKKTIGKDESELFMGVSFNVQEKVAVVTGRAGVLCAAMCRALAEAGAKVAVLDLRPEAAEALAAELGSGAIGLGCNVLDKISVEAAAQLVLEHFNRIDILINGAGGYAARIYLATALLR